MKVKLDNNSLYAVTDIGRAIAHLTPILHAALKVEKSAFQAIKLPLLSIPLIYSNSLFHYVSVLTDNYYFVRCSS